MVCGFPQYSFADPLQLCVSGILLLLGKKDLPLNTCARACGAVNRKQAQER